MPTSPAAIANDGNAMNEGSQPIEVAHSRINRLNRSGKTSTGKELARLVSFDFLDTDHWIEEKNNGKISKIFQDNGEAFFREQEKEAVKWLKTRDHCVISIGGGAWVEEENRNALLGMGWCVWLKVSAEKAWQRIEGHLSQRPLLSKVGNPLETMKSMLTDRAPFYSMAHVSFNTADKNPKEVALEIFRTLKEEHPFDLPPVQK